MMKLTRREALKWFGIASLVAAASGSVKTAGTSKKRPNILWISCEDISPNLGCYGDKNAVTPTLDKLATQAARYTNAFTVAGVCAPNRSAIITSVYPESLGTCDMRCRALLPEKIKCFPEYLRKAGYYCVNKGKKDYQFSWQFNKQAWDEDDRKWPWRNLSNEQPFFLVVNHHITHEGPVNVRSEKAHKEHTPRVTDEQRQLPEKMELPPYYPQTKTAKQMWARYLELITQLDCEVSDLLEQLRKDGLEDDTIVFFWSDHGVGLPRAKRWLYDSGTRIPLIVRIPEKFRTGDQGKPGSVCDDLVSSIDLGPTVLNLAGVDIPEYIQGLPFLGENLPAPRKYIYGTRGRIDERYDMVRSVREKRYHYIRNYQPYKPYYQHNQTPEGGGMMIELRKLHAQGKLNPTAELFMADSRLPEELYDTKTDPHEIHNIAYSPRVSKVRWRLRAAHRKHLFEVKDLGFIPEADLVEREKKVGNRYDILRQPGGDKLLERLYKIAVIAASSDSRGFGMLSEALKDNDAAIRYWGAVGLGNIAKYAGRASDKLLAATKDSSAVVRIAAARALCKMGMQENGLAVLTEEVTSENQWVRLQAAIELDEMGEKARPAIEAMKKACDTSRWPGWPKGNQYTERVARHALENLGVELTAKEN